jgi:hypothetical protein
VTPAQSARTVRHDLCVAAAPPARWRCRVCRGDGRLPDATPCEGACGSWMHWGCYWPGSLTDAERGAFGAAQEADERAYEQAGDREVEVTLGGRRYRVPAAMVGPRAVEVFLDHQIVLCPGCRS